MKFNRNSITLKIDPVHSHSPSRQAIVYDAYKTENSAEALMILLQSANPFRKKYVINYDDYEYIAEARIEIMKIIEDMEWYMETLPKKAQ